MSELAIRLELDGAARRVLLELVAGERYCVVPAEADEYIAVHRALLGDARTIAEALKRPAKRVALELEPVVAVKLHQCITAWLASGLATADGLRVLRELQLKLEAHGVLPEPVRADELARAMEEKLEAVPESAAEGS